MADYESVLKNSGLLIPPTVKYGIDVLHTFSAITDLTDELINLEVPQVIVYSAVDEMLPYVASCGYTLASTEAIKKMFAELYTASKYLRLNTGSSVGLVGALTDDSTGVGEELGSTFWHLFRVSAEQSTTSLHKFILSVTSASLLCQLTAESANRAADILPNDWKFRIADMVFQAVHMIPSPLREDLHDDLLTYAMEMDTCGPLVYRTASLSQPMTYTSGVEWAGESFRWLSSILSTNTEVKRPEILAF